jgi:hypothetical protein
MIPMLGGSRRVVRKRYNRVFDETGLAISALDDMARNADGENNRGIDPEMHFAKSLSHFRIFLLLQIQVILVLAPVLIASWISITISRWKICCWFPPCPCFGWSSSALATLL